MNQFEEKFTKWVDGKLTGKELEAFEKELESHPEAVAEKSRCLRVGSLLREYPAAPALKNADFFSHQLMQRIEAETPRREKKQEREREAGFFFMGLHRLVFAGMACLGIAFGLYETVVTEPVEPDSYVQVVSAKSSNPNVSASTVYDADQKMSVVWLDGLEYVPAVYAQQ